MEGYREENWENTLEAISEPRSGVTPMRSSMGAVAESWRMDWSVRSCVARMRFAASR